LSVHVFIYVFIIVDALLHVVFPLYVVVHCCVDILHVVMSCVFTCEINAFFHLLFFY